MGSFGYKSQETVLWGQPFNEVHPNVFPQSFKCIINQAELERGRRIVKRLKFLSGHLRANRKPFLKSSIEKTGQTFH